MPGQTFLRDKSYEFVPLLENCERKEYSSHSVMEQDSYSGKLKLRIKVLSPLHIGGNQRDYDKEGNAIEKQVCRNKKIVIPGSSLKGAVRTIAEAVSYSCAVKVPDLVLKSVLPLKNKEACFDIEKGLCITCSLFGMMNRSKAYKGKVNFGEFTLVSGGLIMEKIPKQESPFKNYPEFHDVFYKDNRNFNGDKNGSNKNRKNPNKNSKSLDRSNRNSNYKEKGPNYGNERLYYCKACEIGNCQDCKKEDFFQAIEAAGENRKMEFRGRKFYGIDRELRIENDKNNKSDKEKTYYEMIKEGSILEGEILFQNLRKEEGKLLFYALNFAHCFEMKLGYGKPFGFGKIEIEIESIENMSARYPLGETISKEQIMNWIQEYRTESSEEIKAVIHELERVMNKKE